MPDYRIYFIDSDGHFVKAERLVCQDDSEAIETAQELVDGHDVELWQRDRKIAKMDRKSPDGWQEAIRTRSPKSDGQN